MSSHLWSAVPKGLVAVAAMYLWADTTKTVLGMAKSNATVGLSNAERAIEADPVRPARVVLAPRATLTMGHPHVASNDPCWAPDPEYGVRRRIPEPDYVIDSKAPGWSKLSNVDDVSRTRTVPSWKNGLPRGVAFKFVEPGSSYDKLGFETGDTVRRVNGYELRSAAESLAIYQKLRGCKVFAVEVDRHGRALLKTYRVE